MKLDNESVLREILEQSLAGYWDWNIPSGDEYMSPTFKKMLGYNDSEIPNRAESWQKLIFAEDLPGVLKTFDTHVKSKGALPYYNEVRYTHKNGTTVWVICTGKVIAWDNSGNPLRMIGCHVDITERRRKEQEAEDNRRKLQTTFDYIDDFIFVFDYSGTILEVNPTVMNRLGYAKEELVGQKVLMVHSEDLHEECAVILQEVLAGKRNFCPLPLLTKSGETIPVETKVSKAKWGTQDVLIGVSRDITERRRKEQEAEDNRKKLQTTFDYIDDFIFVFDYSGTILEVNPTVMKRLGYAKEELVGQKVLMVHSEDLHEECAVILQEVLAGKRNFCPLPLLTKSGETIPVETKVSKAKWGSQDVLIGVSRDITERKRADEALQRSQKLESLGILAGGIAHDFNNLLGGIFGLIDLAVRTTDKKETDEYLVKALSTIDRARGLTGQLLTFAKGGAPIKKLERLTPFVEETTRFALSGSNVSCRFFIPPDLWPCEFDRNQIGQVIDNIVINAHQSMPEGGTVEVTAENVRVAEKSRPALSRGNYVKIAIKDRGIGMPKEILPKIFDPFFTTKSKGHGLGLAASYSIVKRHGGCIEVESEPGKGSTFAFYLPASPETALPDSGSGAAIHQGSGSILVMDDEEVVRYTVGSMLEKMGYTVHCVINSNDAVEAFARQSAGGNRFAAVILDLTIPGGPGGKETIRQMRMIDKDVPAFVASGYAVDPVMSHPTEYGFSGSICKPFRTVELAELLNMHLKIAR